MADRSKLINLNNEISQYASRKDLTQAMKLLNSAVESGIANSHTYSAAVNANIRCGSVAGAEEVIKQMISRGRKRDVIICTTMMKGYCGDGSLTKAFELLNTMLNNKPTITPNIRTINTLLRGCITTGNIERAEALQKVCLVDLKIAPDVSFWEYLVILMCQGLKLDKASPIIGRLKGDKSMSRGMVNMHLNMARAAAILGDWNTCRKSLKAMMAADQEQSSNADTNESESTQSADIDDTGKKTVLGGKRSWKASQLNNSDTREKSLEIFREHSRSEVQREAVLIQEFMDKRVAREQQEKERLRRASRPDKATHNSDSDSNSTSNSNRNISTDGKGDSKNNKKKKKNKKSKNKSRNADEIEIKVDNDAQAPSSPSPTSSVAAAVSLILHFLRLYSFPSEQASTPIAATTTKATATAKASHTVFDNEDDCPPSKEEKEGKEEKKGKKKKKKNTMKLHGVDLSSSSLSVTVPEAVSASMLGNFGLEVYVRRVMTSEALSVVDKLSVLRCLREFTEGESCVATTKIGMEKKEEEGEKKGENKSKKMKKEKKRSDAEIDIKAGVDQSSGNDRVTDEDKAMNATSLVDDTVTACKEIVARCFDKRGDRLQFSQIFSKRDSARPEVVGQESGADTGEDKRGGYRATKMEICSGAGEWAVSQAKNDPSSNWITLELRADRVYQTFTRSVLSSVGNMCILCGDAMRILTERTESNLLDALFVNHPEPPQQTGGWDSSTQGKHLLTREFFLQASRILRPKGTLTVVTDNLWYGTMLMRIVGSLCTEAEAGGTDSAIARAQSSTTSITSGKRQKDQEHKQTSPKNTQLVDFRLRSVPAKKNNRDWVTAGVKNPSEWKVQEEEAGVALYVGKPGAEAGHVVDSSSYFDRLWKRGKLEERYFIVLKKKRNDSNTNSS